MALVPGSRLGPYEVAAPIGKGGMGEVYRARDTKLKRDVAIKVLPEAFASDAERMKRFAREAELLASLNHPNIAAIYGLEDADGVSALVLELVEGPTLADRIAQGAIPLDEALPIARQIAEALEAAHERGIIHRDLKPANVKVREDGTVKILDFGLAKALDEEVQGDASESPTMSAAATRAGVILGTAAYMSPEQARGKPVDRRADIWAFGVVLYEMLTGRRAFEAEDVSLTLAAVMKSEPDWEVLPEDLSPALRTYLVRCLRKDPRERVRDIGDVRLALEGAFDIPVATTGRTRTNGRALPWVAGIVMGGLVVWGLTRPAAPPVTRLIVSTPPSSAVRLGSTNRDLAISPEGDWLVYEGVGPALYVRHLDRFETARFDVGNLHSPFVSADGAWIGFEEGGFLKKISVQGGPPTTICKVEGFFRGGSWSDNGTIVFAVSRQGLFRVPAAGGEVRPLTKLDADEVGHSWPELLPVGAAVLFAIDRGGSGVIHDVAVASLETGESRVLIRGGTSPRYLTTGHIAYVAGTTVMVVPFDAEELATTGEAIPVLSEVVPKFTGAVNFDVSNDGDLVYVPGDPERGNRSLVWVDRLGRKVPLGFEPRDYRSVALSPDGDRIVSEILDEQGFDLWIQDVTRGTQMRLTFDPGNDNFPTWTPDGARVLFQSDRDGKIGLFWKAADGTGAAERLMPTINPFSTSPDGETLIGVIEQAETGFDLAEVRLDGDATLRPLVVERGTQWYPQLSPSGNWLAYHSWERDGRAIYVRPYPNVDAGRWQVPSEGGFPTWSPSEEELFYRTEDQMMTVSVRVTADGGLELGTPSPLFEGSYLFNSFRHFDVSADGNRFLMMEEEVSGDEPESPDIHVVLNWFEELRALTKEE